jgi:AcrR family transcriptional regulator
LRNKILETAIKLFNEKGINQTSFRDIASNLEISDGHVRYYFKTKEILLMSIFKELDNEIVQGSKVENEINEITITYLLGKIEEIFQKTVKYRFLFVESPKTLSMFPELIKSYRNLIERRKSMILGAFKVFIEKGLFDSSFDKEAQEYAFYTIFIISDGWLRTYLLTSGSEPDKRTIAFHSRLILNILRPYLKDNRL